MLDAHLRTTVWIVFKVAGFHAGDRASMAIETFSGETFRTDWKMNIAKLDALKDQQV